MIHTPTVSLAIPSHPISFLLCPGPFFDPSGGSWPQGKKFVGNQGKILGFGGKGYDEDDPDRRALGLEGGEGEGSEGGEASSRAEQGERAGAEAWP